MWVSKVFVWFVVYSIFGWIYESTYCTICERKWENRGFLYGPVCPIYGTGIVSMMLLWKTLLSDGITLTWWQVFLISFFGSAILEYSTHWTLEKLFHAYWWDYSNMPLNLNGRICLPASILFGLGGLMVVYVLYEPTVELSAHVLPALSEFLSIVLSGFIAADTAITVSALTRFAKVASSINDSVNEHMEQFVSDVQERGASVAENLQERGTAVADGIQERRDDAAAAIAAERERFAAALRDSRLADMSHYMRAAARRARGFSPRVMIRELPGAEQLLGMWSDVRGKHWPHE